MIVVDPRFDPSTLHDGCTSDCRHVPLPEYRRRMAWRSIEPDVLYGRLLRVVEIARRVP